jgi:Leucine-rich repeat (LRR) protein
MNLPNDITGLHLINTSNSPIYLDVPETVNRFTNLEAIGFDNMVKTLPKSIGELKNVTIISLPNNKSLESLPESIADLDLLSFINLIGSNPNVKIPERLKEKLVEEGENFYYVM